MLSEWGTGCRLWRLPGQTEVRRGKVVQFLGLLMIPKSNCVPKNSEVKGREDSLARKVLSLKA